MEGGVTNLHQTGLYVLNIHNFVDLLMVHEAVYFWQVLIFSFFSVG